MGGRGKKKYTPPSIARLPKMSPGVFSEKTFLISGVETLGKVR